MPEAFHNYVVNIVGVVDDRNSGFRSVAALLEMGQDMWPLVRQSMTNELLTNNSIYMQLYGSNKLYRTILQVLHVSSKEL